MPISGLRFNCNRQWAQKTAKFVLDIVCKPKGQIGFSVLPWRWIVERTFAWLANYRRLARDYWSFHNLGDVTAFKKGPNQGWAFRHSL